jgi:hypothetical protein
MGIAIGVIGTGANVDSNPLNALWTSYGNEINRVGGIADTINATYATNMTQLTNNTATLAAATNISTASTLAKRDVNNSIALGSLSIGGAASITNTVAQLFINVVNGQSLDAFTIWQSPASGGNIAFRVDPNGNTVIGSVAGARALTVWGAIVATTTITATGGLIGPLTGNVTGLKGITAGAMLVGAGAGAATVVAAGTNGYIWTSNGPGNQPTWQANAGGGGSSTATYANVKNVSTDATLADVLNRWAGGPVIDSVGAWSSGGVSGLYINVIDPSNPPTIIINGNTRKSTVAVYSGVGNLTPGVSAAGRYSLAADTSTAGTNLFTLSIIAPGGTVLANQLVIGQVLWDGNNFQVGASGGFAYTIQPIVDGLNTRDRFMQVPLFHANGNAALPIATFAALPSAPIVTQHLPISGMRAIITYGCEMLMGATPAVLSLFPVYSTSTNGGTPNQYFPSPSGTSEACRFLGAASGQATVCREVISPVLTDQWFNFSFQYTTASATPLMQQVYANIRFVRN